MVRMVQVSFIMAVLALASGDEMAFVDVSSTDAINIRQLDVPVNSKRGVANFFVEDPMAAHDWGIQSSIVKSMLAELTAVAKPTSVAAGRVRSVEKELGLLWSVMPKNEDGRITNSTMRYVVHRYFTQKHGWSIKGLQPAGASWLHVMSVTPDVRQVTKYVVPTYLHKELLDYTGTADLDLHRLAVYISVLEHLIHAEMLEYLYSVHKIMQVEIAGPKTEGETDTILSTFMLLYAFGTNLEVSTKRDLDKALRFLEANHKGWQLLHRHMGDLRKSMPDAANNGFDGMLGLVDAIAADYRKWQNPTCNEARDRLMSMPSYKDGRVSLADISPTLVPDYRLLFAEDLEYLQRLGALDQTNSSQLQLIVPNYITSQALCLTTASFYTVCCHNPCEDILAKLERAAVASSATPEQIASALAEGGDGRVLIEAERSTLDALASDGRIGLYGRPLAEWLHSVFPADCPMPTGHEITNPKTADEWMSDPGNSVQDTEEIMLEMSENLARYTTMGLEVVDESVKEEEAAEVIETKVDVIVEPYSQHFREGRPASWIFGVGFGTLMKMGAAASMLAMVGAYVQSALRAIGIGSEKPRARPFDSHGLP